MAVTTQPGNKVGVLDYIRVLKSKGTTKIKFCTIHFFYFPGLQVDHCWTLGFDDSFAQQKWRLKKVYCK